MRKELSATYARTAAIALMAAPSATDTEKAVRKALMFWAAYENIALAKSPPRDIVQEFARVFRECLQRHCTDEGDVTVDKANTAALAAIREWWEPFRRLAEVM